MSCKNECVDLRKQQTELIEEIEEKAEEIVELTGGICKLKVKLYDQAEEIKELKKKNENLVTELQSTKRPRIDKLCEAHCITEMHKLIKSLADKKNLGQLIRVQALEELYADEITASIRTIEER